MKYFLTYTNNRVGYPGGPAQWIGVPPGGATNCVVLGNNIRNTTLGMAGGGFPGAFVGGNLGAGSVPVTTTLVTNTDANNFFL